MSSSNPPTLCVLHEAISRDNAIAKIVMGQVQAALAAGWNVSVVAKFLDESLRDRVTWLPLTVPPRSFFLQWTTARHFIRKAMGGRSFDVIHAHQPQVADLADVFQCHFLTRVAYERKCLETRPGARAKIIRLQQQGVLYAEDRCFRRWNPATRMIFISAMLRDEFHRLYRRAPLEEVIPNPCPPMREISPQDRQAARTRWVGDRRELVVGYLGGLHERKGYRRLLTAIAADPNLFLLMAGPHCEGFSDPALHGRIKAVGLVDDVSSFYAACDVVAVPSLFEPLGMVAFEAATHGVPVIATEEVGALPHLLEFGAGAKWNPSQPLGPLARELLDRREIIRGGARRMAEELSEQHHNQRLLGIYDQVLRSKTPARGSSLRRGGKPTLCLIHEAISQDSGIAKLVLWQTKVALDAGWDVTVVAKYLDPSLQDRVHWLKLTVPRRFFLLKWTTARHFIRQAIADRSFDVIHAHQPQVADLADVFHCHFLTRVAYERHCLETRPGLRPRFIRLQQQGVLHVEDRCHRHWNPATHILFCSDLMRQEFDRLYGLPPSYEVSVSPCPPMRRFTAEERRAARKKLIGERPGLVVGYLGGLNERKGYKRVIPAVQAEEDLVLMMVGAYSKGFSVPALGNRIAALGFVEDISQFYAACDVLIVPSLFEPLGVVAFEAVSHGVPVIATQEVGALPHLLEFGVGAAWTPGQPLGPLVRTMIADRPAFERKAQQMVEELSEQHIGQSLLATYERLLRKKRGEVRLAPERAISTLG